jgi:hypothetical protein
MDFVRYDGESSASAQPLGRFGLPQPRTNLIQENRTVCEVAATERAIGRYGRVRTEEAFWRFHSLISLKKKRAFSKMRASNVTKDDLRNTDRRRSRKPKTSHSLKPLTTFRWKRCGRVQLGIASLQPPIVDVLE